MNNGLEDSAAHFARYRFCFQVLFISFIFVTLRCLPYDQLSARIPLVIEDKSGVEVRKIGRNHFPTINPHIPLCTRYYLESTSIQCATYLPCVC